MRRWIVLFDWDGTLIDSLGFKIRNAGELFEDSFGLPSQQVEASYRRHSGKPRRQVFEAICAENGLPALSDEIFAELSRRFSLANRAAIASRQTEQLLFPDTLLTLQALKKLGCSLYISSAADPDEIREVAHALGVEGFFYEILGSTPGFTKGLLHVEHVLQAKEAQRQEIVFVGDEPLDVTIGREAGVVTIVKQGTHSLERLSQEKPDYVISSLSELPDLLLSIQ